MTILVFIFARLIANPRFARLWLTTRALLRQLVRCLIDAETGAPRALPVGAAPIVERHLQFLEACIARLIWLRARDIAGLPHMPNANPFAFIPPRRTRSAQALALHALALMDRFTRLETLARRRAARMSHDAERLHHAPASTRALTLPQFRASLTNNHATLTTHILSTRATLTALILRTRAARGLEGWTPTRPSAALIPQTGPPAASTLPQSPIRSEIGAHARRWAGQLRDSPRTDVYVMFPAPKLGRIREGTTSWAY